MLTSLLKTLAGKHDSTVSKMARKYAATIETPDGPRRCMQARADRGEGKRPLVATFGGIPLRRQKAAVLRDRAPVPATSRRKELIHRLLAGQCEICGQSDKVRVHQIRKLDEHARLLQKFAVHLDATGAEFVTIEMALAWAGEPIVPAGSVVPAMRLLVVRGLARYLAGIDPRTEIPPTGLIRLRRHRRPP